MLEIFQYGFMIRAILAGIAVSLLASLIGVFLVVRRYSLISDTIAHISLLGVVIGIATKNSPILFAVIISIAAAFGIEKLQETKKLFSESVLALFLSGSLAIAVLIISATRGMNVNFMNYLFGSIATVTQFDVYVISVLSIIVIFTIGILYKRLFLISLDENLAQGSGIDNKKLNLILLVMTAVTVSLAIRIVGILLIGALMIIPVLTAVQFAKSFKQTTIFALSFSFLSVISGIFISYYFDLSSGGTIVLISLILFMIGLIVNHKNS